MMPIWAEKEMRNLKRMKEAGIRCPTAHHINNHVLVMDFIGKAGWAAPLLKDASLSLDKLQACYKEIIIAMRTLYQKANLVHTDLSEYNILYFDGHLYIIDVSQAVEPFHCNANEFLRQDCLHVSDFFRRNGVAVMTTRELFDFIVDRNITDEAVESYLDVAELNVLQRGDEMADSVFVQAYIPNTLNEVIHVERLRLEDMYYKTITGVGETLSSLSESAEEEKRCDSLLSGIIKAPVDIKLARKENKKKREARKHKLPKAVKKRRKKLSSNGARR